MRGIGINMEILNIGCGNDTYGTHFIDLYPQREEVIKCDVDKERLPIKSSTMDKIYTKCVFEHLTNPGFALKEIYRVLKKGGELELITDNASYWYYSLDEKTHTGRYESNIKFGEDDQHFSLFTDWHLSNHLRKAGFKVKKIEHQDNTGDGTSIKNKAVKIVNKTLRLVGLKRMSYGRIRIVGVKNES